MTDQLAAQGIPSPLEAHSIPLDNPLHGPPPARFRDGEVLVIEYRTDPEAIAALVPEPLVPVGDTVMVQVARWGDVPGLGRDTHEVNVMVGRAMTAWAIREARSPGPTRRTSSSTATGQWPVAGSSTVSPSGWPRWAWRSAAT